MTPSVRLVTRGTLGRCAAHALVTGGVLDLVKVVALVPGGVLCLSFSAASTVLTLERC